MTINKQAFIFIYLYIIITTTIIAITIIITITIIINDEKKKECTSENCLNCSDNSCQVCNQNYYLYENLSCTSSCSTAAGYYMSMKAEPSYSLLCLSKIILKIKKRKKLNDNS